MNRPFILWITGPPASGKSTLTRILVRELRREQPIIVLESDPLRRILTPQASYQPAERDAFYLALGDLALLLAAQEVSVAVDATAHRRLYRDRVREKCRTFVEVAVSCPTSECERRDPKGIYVLARQGRIASLPGLQVEYEAPRKPEFTYHSDRESPESAASRLLQYLIRNHILDGTCGRYMSSDW